MSNKQKVLIVDDSEMNRSILADILGDKYEIIEAENGVQAVATIQKLAQNFLWCFWIWLCPKWTVLVCWI